ncbi:hypothetical protein [Phenylobacterium sp.]|jgi:hypothetical protein|uniref:hypothetical protein n=1 Tax=Phenylobacterium sp. TaxID=1871053 RepID=UPI002F3F2099
MSPVRRGALAAVALATITVHAAAAADPAVEVLQRGYVRAWNRADAAAIAGFFCPDGDSPIRPASTPRAALTF